MPVWLPVLLVALLVVGLKLKKDQAAVNIGNVVNNVYVSLSKNTILSAVPQSLRNNVYLKQKESGCCKTFSGNVAVSVVLVSDSAGQWDEESIANLQTTLDTSKVDIIAEAADYGADISLDFHYYNATLTGDMCSAEHKEDWQEPALKSAGLPTLSKLHNYLTEKYASKEAPVVFAFNKAGRAYARNGSSEYFVLFSDCDALTFQHELSHIFGARDYYYPKDVKTCASKHFQDSIMLTCETADADALTAYLVGWTDAVADNALEFLKETNHLTASYIREENESEVFTGNGTKEFESGIYTGDLLRGVCHGSGTMQYDNGGWYTGQWENNAWAGSGTGKYIHKDGGIYEGTYLNGKRHGQGTYTFPSGSVYTGEWSEGEMSGTGTLRYDDGGWYTGQWASGKFTGVGKGMQYLENGTYEGEFLDGKRHGQGTYIWSSGARYSGQWTNGEMTGYGTYTKADGSVKTGMFENGKFKG